MMTHEPENTDPREAGEDEKRAVLESILDAPGVKEKLDMILEKKEMLDARLLGNLAAAFDIPPDTDHPDELYEHIVQYLETRARFETGRLR